MAGRTENLKPKTSAKARGKLGGIKSGKVKREKKLMSQIYAEFLAKEHEVVGRDGQKKTLSGHALLSSVMSKVLSRGDSSAVSMMREIREGTEGSKIKTETVLTINTDDEKVAAVLAEYGVNKPASEN